MKVVTFFYLLLWVIALYVVHYIILYIFVRLKMFIMHVYKEGMIKIHLEQRHIESNLPKETVDSSLEIICNVQSDILFSDGIFRSVKKTGAWTR